MVKCRPQVSAIYHPKKKTFLEKLNTAPGSRNYNEVEVIEEILQM